MMGQSEGMGLRRLRGFRQHLLACVLAVLVHHCGRGPSWGDADVFCAQIETPCETEGALSCGEGGRSVEECMRDENGCLAWSTETQCEDYEECTLREGEAQCVCSDPCRMEGWTRCGSESMMQACTWADEGCLLWSDARDCSLDGRICDASSGQGECACPDVCLERESRCRETFIQTCAPAENGCLDFLDTTDCAEELLTCRDSAAPAQCVIGSGGSCVDFEGVLDVPFEKAGEDFREDYWDRVELTGDSCLHRVACYDAVFALNVPAGWTVVVWEAGTLDAVISIQHQCGDAHPCLVSDDRGESEGVRYTAEGDERVFMIVETNFSDPAFADYDILIDLAQSELCGDGLDNDLDGRADCDDAECFGDPAFCAVELNCRDGNDNDGDGTPDCPDSDCTDSPWCSPYRGFWEGFQAGDEADVEGWELRFTPDAADPNLYVWEAFPGPPGYPVEPGSGAVTAALDIGDEDFIEHALSVMPPFEFFGVAYGTVYVGSNGFLTFGGGDAWRDNNLADFFEYPRVAGFDVNLNTVYGGTITLDEFTDKVAMTYQDVRRGRYEGGNSFQIILNADGAVELYYSDIAAIDGGIIGISSGAGNGTFPEETNFIP